MYIKTGRGPAGGGRPHGDLCRFFETTLGELHRLQLVFDGVGKLVHGAEGGASLHDARDLAAACLDLANGRLADLVRAVEAANASQVAASDACPVCGSRRSG